MVLIDKGGLITWVKNAINISGDNLLDANDLLYLLIHEESIVIENVEDIVELKDIIEKETKKCAVTYELINLNNTSAYAVVPVCPRCGKHFDMYVEGDEARKRIVELLGDQAKIELFARQTADGWDSFGNEL